MKRLLFLSLFQYVAVILLLAPCLSGTFPALTFDIYTSSMDTMITAIIVPVAPST